MEVEGAARRTWGDLVDVAKIGTYAAALSTDLFLCLGKQCFRGGQMLHRVCDVFLGFLLEDAAVGNGLPARLERFAQLLAALLGCLEGALLLRDIFLRKLHLLFGRRCFVVGYRFKYVIDLLGDLLLCRDGILDRVIQRGKLHQGVIGGSMQGRDFFRMRRLAEDVERVDAIGEVEDKAVWWELMALKAPNKV